MVAFPVITACVLVALTAAVAGQWWSRRRGHQLAWALALLWGLVGTVAYIAAAEDAGSAWLFRLYYLGGAVLVAPLLGLGSAYLLRRPGWARIMLAVTVVCGLLATVGLVAAPLDAQALSSFAWGPGANVVSSVPVIVAVIIGNSCGTLAVVGVALRSVWAAARGHSPARYLWGNALIAGGTLLIAAAGSLARLGQGAGFWATMTAGWLVLYGGFALVSAVVAPVRAPASA